MRARQAEPGGAVRASSLSGPAVQRGHIVSSKVSPPPLRPGIVDRPQLLDGLIATAHAPVVLVSAPAGYGKTTLLSLWRERDARPFAWVSLDAADDDPVALVSAIVAGLDRITELDPQIGEALRVRQPPLEEFVLPALVEACAASGQPFVLVLDDVHLVTERRSHTAIGYLIERLPAGCQLALATRTDPALPLASWRAHGQLVEIRAGALALGAVEAHALVEAAGVRLDGARMAQLIERTEGWAAGLYLAALSLRGRADPEQFVDEFAGSSRHIADFLTEDVLARQTQDAIRFLLSTCVLEELTASLCDALTGGADADAMLPELERSNLFVVPLDEERRAYRYHHLFAQYLRAELARREPDLAPELHRRAWRWYREHGMVGRAVKHAQAAGDLDVAGELVAAAWSDQIRDGQIGMVRGWIEGLRRVADRGPRPARHRRGVERRADRAPRGGGALRRGGPARSMGGADARRHGVVGLGGGDHVGGVRRRRRHRNAPRCAARRRPGAGGERAPRGRSGDPRCGAYAARGVRPRARRARRGDQAGRRGELSGCVLARPAGGDRAA